MTTKLTVPLTAAGWVVRGSMEKLTKAEVKIVNYVREANGLGALAGLGTYPGHETFTSKEKRFVKRLYEAGVIVWVERTKHLGAGWVLPETIEKFVPLPQVVGMFRTGLPEGQSGLSHFTAGVYAILDDRFLVSFPIGLNFRRPEWIAKDRLVSWLDGCAPS